MLALVTPYRDRVTATGKKRTWQAGDQQGEAARLSGKALSGYCYQGILVFLHYTTQARSAEERHITVLSPWAKERDCLDGFIPALHPHLPSDKNYKSSHALLKTRLPTGSNSSVAGNHHLNALV